MKAISVDWFRFNRGTGSSPQSPAGRLETVMRFAGRALFALVTALTVITGSVWLASTPDTAIYLQASLWASSFVFLGLSIDLQRPSNHLSLATGFVLPILTDLSARVAVEFAIVAATVIAAWLAGGIWRR